jgi:hypothetical protein
MSDKKDRSKYISAVLKAPMGAFLIALIFLAFNVITFNEPLKLYAVLGSSLLVLIYIYSFYTIGLILIVPTIWILHRSSKLNAITSIASGGIFGALVGFGLLGVGSSWIYLGPIMGFASGYVLWKSWPKDVIHQ